MAIYHLRMKKSNSGGKTLSPSLHLEYISREGKYSKKRDLILNEVKNLPKEFKDIEEFWKYSETYERENANLYRELEISLPKELSIGENEKLVKEFTDYLFGKDFVYNYSIHISKDYNGEEQPHVHIMFNERKLDGHKRKKEDFFRRGNSRNPERGGAKKDEIWTKKSTLQNIRKDWETFLNIELEKKGIEPVSCKTLKAQKRIAELNNDKEKAEKLDRDPISIKGHILYLQESKLTEEEKKEKEIFQSQRVLKNGTAYMDKIVRKIKKIKSKIEDYNKDQFEILEKIREADSQIISIKSKMDEKKIEDTAYNIVSKKEYYNLLNDNKKIEKELKSLKDEKKIRQLQIRKSKNNERIAEIRNEIKNDLKKNFVFRKTKERILNKYNYSVKKKGQEKTDYEIYVKENYSEYSNIKETLYSIKHFQSIYNQKTVKEINKIEKEYKGVLERLSNDRELIAEENSLKEEIEKKEYGEYEKKLKEIVSEINSMEERIKNSSLNKDFYKKNLNKRAEELKKLTAKRKFIKEKIEKEFENKKLKSLNPKIQEKLQAEKILDNIKKVKKANNIFEKIEKSISKKNQKKDLELKEKRSSKKSKKPISSSGSKGDSLYGQFTLKDAEDLDNIIK